MTVLARGKPATEAEASTVAKAKAEETLAQARSQLTAAIKLGCAGYRARSSVGRAGGGE